LKKFALSHCRFEKAMPEVMQARGHRLESVAYWTVENIGFAGDREISHDGVREIAASIPFIKSLRMDEVREYGSC
jgi:hypothetical protein